MAIILLVCIVVTAASAAPTAGDGLYRDWPQESFERMELNKLQEVNPARRSNYGSLYISPCASAAAYAPTAAAVSAYASPTVSTPYSYNHPTYQPVPPHRGYPSHYGHSSYRSEDELQNEQEMLGLSDVNHVAFEHVSGPRYSYGAAPVVQGSAASGPVVGVFSNANVGGCSVPLLVSCSPSIAHGKMVKSQPYYNSGTSLAQQSYSYRAVDEHSHHDEADKHQEMAAQSFSESSPHNSKSITDNHQ